MKRSLTFRELHDHNKWTATRPECKGWAEETPGDRILRIIGILSLFYEKLREKPPGEELVIDLLIEHDMETHDGGYLPRGINLAVFEIEMLMQSLGLDLEEDIIGEMCETGFDPPDDMYDEDEL